MGHRNLNRQSCMQRRSDGVPSSLLVGGGGSASRQCPGADVALRGVGRRGCAGGNPLRRRAAPRGAGTRPAGGSRRSAGAPPPPPHPAVFVRARATAPFFNCRPACRTSRLTSAGAQTCANYVHLGASFSLQTYSTGRLFWKRSWNCVNDCGIAYGIFHPLLGMGVAVLTSTPMQKR